MPHNDHEVEQQITSLANRIDPNAFERMNDHSLQGRRVDALDSAAAIMRRVQALLAFGAIFLVGTTLAVYLVVT